MKHGFPKHQSAGYYSLKKQKGKCADFSSLIKVVQKCVRSTADHDYVEPCLPNLKYNYRTTLCHGKCRLWGTLSVY
jgi:hypothetical protein